MQHTIKSTHTWQVWLVALVAGVLVSLFAGGVALADDPPEGDGSRG